MQCHKIWKSRVIQG